MCGGASATQDQLQTEEANFYQTQIQAYNTAYSNFSTLQNTLNAQFAPILAKGPNQFGFSDAEVNNLNAIATQGTATNYAQASKALNEQLATEDGGEGGLPTGAQDELKGQLAATAASTESAETLGIQQAGYAQGAGDYQGAVEGEETLASGWNPNAFAGSATSSANTANTEANTIEQQQNSIWTGVIGALGGVAGQAAGQLKPWG